MIQQWREIGGISLSPERYLTCGLHTNQLQEPITLTTRLRPPLPSKTTISNMKMLANSHWMLLLSVLMLHTGGRYRVDAFVHPRSVLVRPVNRITAMDIIPSNTMTASAKHKHLQHSPFTQSLRSFHLNSLPAGQLFQQLTAPGSLPIALAINAVLFTALLSKLRTMLTPTGLWHAGALGTGLWATLGAKGWLYCVLYLFWGQAVTKVRFEDKQVSVH